MSADVVPWGWYPTQVFCACQLGPCGYCKTGRCSQCAWARHEIRGITVQPRRLNNHLLDRHGRRVVQPPIPVHQVGYNCGYVCPCHRQGHPDNNRQGIGTVQRQAVLW